VKLNVRPDNVRRKCRKLNRLITEYRVKVEHAICDLKHYKTIAENVIPGYSQNAASI
jgi:hypothetical protein